MTRTPATLTLSYPVRITEPEPGEFLAEFPTVPEAITGASSRAEALELAADALVVALEGIVLDGRSLPASSAASAEEIAVPVPIGAAARLVLMQVAAARGLSNRAIAELIGRDEKQVRRILSGRGASLEATLEVLRALGVVPVMTVVDLPVAA